MKSNLKYKKQYLYQIKPPLEVRDSIRSFNILKLVTILFILMIDIIPLFLIIEGFTFINNEILKVFYLSLLISMVMVIQFICIKQLKINEQILFGTENLTQQEIINLNLFVQVEKEKDVISNQFNKYNNEKTIEEDNELLSQNKPIQLSKRRL
ncbi:TPA: hypothetical protein NV714_003491 [Escherichia coli]|nr:hypothetical protein [Escherichia coli]